MDRGVTTLRTTRGLGPSPGMRIDGYLDSEDVEILYNRWKDTWPAPVDHQGGIKVLTCEKVLSVGYSELSKVYGVKRAKRFFDVAETNAAIK